jgi:hypothetical protein
MDPLTPNHNGLPFKTLKDQNDFVVRWGHSLLSPTHGVQVSSEYKSNLGAATWNTGPAVISSSIGFGFINYETRTPIVNGGHRFQRFKAFAP